MNDVTNINLIDNKAHIKGTCNKDDINILACACMCTRLFVPVHAPVYAWMVVRVHLCTWREREIIDNRLFMAPHPVRAWSAYKDMDMLIHMHACTHACTSKH